MTQPISRDEIFEKVKLVLIDALAVDDDDVVPEATLRKDLGAESIDMLDIVFKLEQAFKIKIKQGELFPDNAAQDPRYVQKGKITPEGLKELRANLPHLNFALLEQDPSLSRVWDILTVDTLVKFLERKLA